MNGFMKKTNRENGQKLKGFRKQNNLTLQDMSKIVNRSTRTIRYWESGDVTIPKNIIEKLNEEYNIRLTIAFPSGASVTKTTMVPKNNMLKSQLQKLQQEFNDKINKILETL